MGDGLSRRHHRGRHPSLARPSRDSPGRRHPSAGYRSVQPPDDKIGTLVWHKIRAWPPVRCAGFAVRYGVRRMKVDFKRHLDPLPGTEDPVSIEEQIESNRQNIRSDGYAMSIGEILNMYRDHEIIIRPEFQRLFRWPIEKQSKLIESILLGIPLPPIFVAQMDDARWEVVDGLQRLSTILQFAGELRDEATEETLTASTLTKTKYIPALDGMTYSALPPSVRLQFKRSRLDFRILLRESDDAVKYELFDRLNSGGMPTSPQEVRTATLIMSNPTLNGALQQLRDEEDVVETLALTARQNEEQYDLELLVRYCAFHESTPEELSAFSDMETFLTEKLHAMARSPEADWRPIIADARGVFSVAAALGPAAFRKYDASRERTTGGFSVSTFEAVTSGISAHLADWLALSPDARSRELEERLKCLWADETFRSNSGAGVRATTRAPRMPEVGYRIFDV